MRHFTSRPTARSRWLAACAAAAFGLAPVGAAAAQDVAQYRAPAPVVFALPSQSLDEALITFARVANVQVLYGPDLVRGLRSAPLEGRAAPQEGLRRLLQGTGLRAVQTSPGAFTLTRAQAGVETQSAVLVDEVVVTASRQEQPREQLASAVSILSAEAIENQQLKTLDDVLQRIPGVTIIRSGGLGQNTQVRMRGFTTKHVLTMIDGVKLNNPAEADNQFGLEHVFLDNVERVEVLRGPQSGLYGGDASAGVIHLITRRPQGDPDLRVSAMYGDHDTYEVALGSMGRVGGVGYSAGLTRYETGGISLASRPPGNIEPDGYENLTASLRVDGSPMAGLNLEAWLRYTDSENDIDDSMLAADNPLGLPAWLFQDSPGSVKNQQLLTVLKGDFETLGGQLVHSAQVSHVNLESEYATPDLLQESEGRTTEASYHATWRFADGGFLLGGVEHRRENGRFEQPSGGGFATVDDSISETGVFATFTFSPLAGAWLSGAVRHDDNSLFGGNTTWRAAVAYNLPEGADLPGVGTKLRFAYGTGAEAPGLRQLLGSSPTYQGNPDLTPESSWMWDLGFDQRLDSGLASWSVSYYEGEATDGIFNIFDPATGMSSPQNVDSPVRMKGIEVEARLHPAAWIDITFNYTDSSAVQLSSGGQLFGRPKQEGSAAVTVRPHERLSVTLDGYWRGEFFSDYPSDYVMPSYGLANLSASWRITDVLRLNARIHNLFDKVYEEKLGDSAYPRTAQVRLTATF